MNKQNLLMCLNVLFSLIGTYYVKTHNVKLPMIENNETVGITILIFVIIYGFLAFWIVLGNMVYKYKIGE